MCVLTCVCTCEREGGLEGEEKEREKLKQREREGGSKKMNLSECDGKEWDIPGRGNRIC